MLVKHFRAKSPLCRHAKTLEMFPWEKKRGMPRGWSTINITWLKTAADKASICFTSDEAVASPYD